MCHRYQLDQRTEAGVTANQSGAAVYRPNRGLCHQAVWTEAATRDALVTFFPEEGLRLCNEHIYPLLQQKASGAYSQGHIASKWRSGH